MEIPEMHQQGLIFIENINEIIKGKEYNKIIEGDIGIQMAKDGRIWICINGIAFIRFNPFKYIKEEKKKGD